jgi:formate-dependent nitrite reductase membrane component NrfD
MNFKPRPAPTTTSPASGDYDGTTYYGRPALKPAPFENSVVGGYIFLAGLCGAAQLIATVADMAGAPRREGLVRRGRLVSLLAPTLGSVLLVYDLHTPQRFYNMLRIARPTSPMSIGTWILMGFSAFSGVTAGLQVAADRILPGWARLLRGIARVTQVPAALAGAGLGTYTASLLSSTSTPLWAAAPKSMAVEFGSSSVASGAAALAMAERHAGSRSLARKLDTLALAALAVELGASVVSEATYHAKGISAATDAAQGTRTLARIGTIAPFALQMLAGKGTRRNSGVLSDVASLAILAGSYCLRTGVMEAGDESARRPQDYFRFSKPGNLPK